MAVITLAAFQRFRWLLVAAVLSFIVILLSLSNGTFEPCGVRGVVKLMSNVDIRGSIFIPFKSDSASSGKDVTQVPLRILPVGDSVTQG